MGGDDTGPRRPDVHPGGTSRPPQKAPRLRGVVFWLGFAAALVLAFVAVARVSPPSQKVTKEAYTTFMSDVRADRVAAVTFTGNGTIKGTLTGGATFTTQGPLVLPDQDLAVLDQHDVARRLLRPRPQDGVGWDLWPALPFRSCSSLRCGCGSLGGARAA